MYFTRYAFELYVKDRSKKLRVHANRIGRMCIAWSNLELDLGLLLSTMMDIKDPPIKNTILGLMEMRETIQAILAIGFAHKPYDSWYTELAALMNEIDNEIRPERNRTIHDFWFELPNPNEPAKSEIRRAKVKPKVKNTQAFQKELALIDMKPIVPDDISAITKRIEKASVAVWLLKQDFSHATWPERHPKPNLTLGHVDDQKTSKQ